MSFGVAVYVLVIHLDGTAPWRFHLVPPCVPSPRSLRPCCRFRLRVLIERFYDSSPRHSAPALLFLSFSSGLYERVKYTLRTCNYANMSNYRAVGCSVANARCRKARPEMVHSRGVLFHCRWNTTICWLPSHKFATRDAEKALGDHCIIPD